jgi:hypothetical protein
MKNFLEKNNITYTQIDNHYFTEKGTLLVEEQRVEISKNINFWFELFKKECFAFPIYISSNNNLIKSMDYNGNATHREFDDELKKYIYFDPTLYEEHCFTIKENDRLKEYYYFDSIDYETTKALKILSEYQVGPRIEEEKIDYPFFFYLKATYDFTHKKVIVNNQPMNSIEFIDSVYENIEKLKKYLVNKYEDKKTYKQYSKFALDKNNELALMVQTQPENEDKNYISLPYDSELAMEFLRGRMEFQNNSTVTMKYKFKTISKVNKTIFIDYEIKTSIPIEQLTSFKEYREKEIKKAIIEMNRFENLYEAPDQFENVLESLNLIINRDWIIMDEVKECFDIIEEENTFFKKFIINEKNRLNILGTALHLLIKRKEHMRTKIERIHIFFNSLKMMNSELGKLDIDTIETAMEFGLKKSSNEKIKEFIKVMKQEQIKKVFIK